ncbi:MAG TPA: DUF3822 family protein [Hymenobacter sp.]|uniref:DUF3822 family protein n=1 Tax=Hymenobacter sp. TaxID=1898978 RepID=UPI002D7EE472|nr:DUF3822 family protein [Hymenobacter sp.]HET9503330.1 DUF3822 family protein [Hymenobacter sp.]
MPALSTFASAPAAPAITLRDDTFAPDNLGAYQLAVLAAGGRCALAVLETARQKIVVLEDLALPTPGGLPALAAGHELLGRAGWGRVRVAVGGGAFTLLPAPLFRPGDEASYLQLHHALGATEQAVAYALPASSPANELVSIFAADAELAGWLRATHGPEARLLHHTSPLLAGLLYQQGPTAPARHLSLHLAGAELTLLVLGTQLEYCNVFSVSTPEDVVYYTILAMQELGLNPDQDPVTVWGELTGDSAAFALLATYVRHLRFGNRPFGLHYSYRLNEVAESRYFELFSLAFCG